MNEELKVIISAEIDKLKKGVSDAKKHINTFKGQVSKASKDCEKHFKSIGEAAKKGFAMVAAGIGVAIVALAGMSAATEDYRVNQGKLLTAFEASGMGAEAAADTYQYMYSVLGDDAESVEAASNIARITSNEEDLAEWTETLTGIWGVYGDSIPLSTMTEAIAETIATGEVTGDLSRVLAEAGVNEEEFEAKLASCNTEAEREQLIRETLNDEYSEAADLYKKNNSALMKQRAAQVKLTDAMAKLGAAIAPVVTAFTEFATEALAAVTPYIEDLVTNLMPVLEEVLAAVVEGLKSALVWMGEHKTLLAVMAGLIMGVVTAIGLYNTVAAVKAAMAAAEVTTVWGLVSAYAAQAVAMGAALLPYLLIAAAIAAVIAIIIVCVKYWDEIKAAIISAATSVYEFLQPAFEAIMEFMQPVIEWVKSAWENIVSFFVSAWGYIQEVWAAVTPYFSAIWEGIKLVFSLVAETLGGFFSAAWANIQIVWDLVVSYFSTIWESIKTIFSVVKDILGNYFRLAWSNIKIVWNVVVSYFKTIWENIKLIFSVVKDVLSGNFRGAWESIKQIFSNFVSFFRTLWNSVKQVFANVGTFFTNSFKTAYNGITLIFNNIKTYFSNIWSAIKSIFSNVGTAIGQAINSTVKTAINKVLSGAVNIINGFIGAINAAIGVINAIPGVSIKKISKLSVPALAKGGVVDKATLAVIGEQGKEAVVPLENNLEWLDKLADRIAAKQGGSNKPIILTVDGKVFAQTSIDSINALTRQQGTLGLNLV